MSQGREARLSMGLDEVGIDSRMKPRKAGSGRRDSGPRLLEPAEVARRGTELGRTPLEDKHERCRQLSPSGPGRARRFSSEGRCRSQRLLATGSL